MWFFNIKADDDKVIHKLRSTTAGVVFSEYDLWCLETHKFITDLMLFRLCKMIQTPKGTVIKTPKLYIVDPQILNRLVNIADLHWEVDNCVKRRKELGVKNGWSKRLENGQTLVLLFNFPVNLHWFSTHVSLSPDRKNILLRFYNSMNNFDPLRTQHAKLITGLLHLLGCNPSRRPVIEVTRQHSECLQQRRGRNLCGIHCVMRVWLASTNQDGDDTKITTSVVDHVREYCLLALFNEDKRLCYPLTPEEKHANDFVIKAPIVIDV